MLDAPLPHHCLSPSRMLCWLLMLPELAQSRDRCALPQMGRQLHGVLTNHMQRYTYSATGALRWKRDMTEYCDWVHSLRAPLVDEKFEELQVWLPSPRFGY